MAKAKTKALRFLENVQHNGKTYFPGDDAVGLDEKTEASFKERGLIGAGVDVEEVEATGGGNADGGTAPQA